MMFAIHNLLSYTYNVGTRDTKSCICIGYRPRSVHRLSYILHETVVRAVLTLYENIMFLYHDIGKYYLSYTEFNSETN